MTLPGAVHQNLQDSWLPRSLENDLDGPCPNRIPKSTKQRSHDLSNTRHRPPLTPLNPNPETQTPNPKNTTRTPSLPDMCRPPVHALVDQQQPAAHKAQGGKPAGSTTTTEQPAEPHAATPQHSRCVLSSMTTPVLHALTTMLQVARWPVDKAVSHALRQFSTTVIVLNWQVPG